MTSSGRPVAPSTEAHPFSRPFAVADLRDEGLDVDIEADDAECRAVAHDIGLPAVGALAASFQIARQPGGRLHVTGNVKARITQTCVVSLEPFESEIEQSVEIDFAPSRDVPAERDVLRPRDRAVSRRRRGQVPEVAEPAPPHADVGEEDPPDPIVDGRIDLGTVAVEFLTLGLDFYPRKPGVHFVDTVVGETGAQKPSAFAKLERLKDRS